jgi:hypothetical protein
MNLVKSYLPLLIWLCTCNCSSELFVSICLNVTSAFDFMPHIFFFHTFNMICPLVKLWVLHVIIQNQNDVPIHGTISSPSGVTSSAHEGFILGEHALFNAYERYVQQN